MVTLMNRLNQPVPVNVGGGKSIHFLAKESKQVTFEEFQYREVKEKIDKSILLVLKMEN